MNRFTFLATAAAAACVLSTALPASAASNASASISGFGFTLYDLSPGDGVTPSIEFFTSPYGSFVASSANDSTAGSQSGTAFSLVPFGPASSVSSAGVATASGSVSGNLGAGLLIASSGSAGGAVLPGFSSGFSAEASGGYFNFGFSLSPSTLVTFQGTVNLLAQTTVGAEVSDFFFNTENASANAGIAVNGPSPSGGGSQSSNDNRSIFASFQQVFDPETGTSSFVGDTQTLSGVVVAGSFTNLSGGNLLGTLQVSTSVGGFSNVTAVPEPGTWGLMLAGLLGVGAVARRRGR